MTRHSMRMLEMEMHNSLDRLGRAVIQATRENDRMRAMLLAASDQFRLYVDHHLAKFPPDLEKAMTNSDWATKCRDAAKMEADDTEAP